MSTMGKRIYVYYDGDQVIAPTLMGTLDAMTLRGKEVFSFQFDAHWLQDKLARSFDPDLQLFNGRQETARQGASRIRLSAGRL